MQRIALLGLGAMGGGMAANWLKKRFPLTIWNRTASKTERHAAEGALVARSPREAAQGADVIVSMVADDHASREVWFGSSGALDGMRSSAICIESSTVSPDWVGELAQAVQRKGGRFLDAPVGSSRPAAESGQLVFFVGGDADDFARAREVLEPIASRLHHLGGVGAGTRWKLVNNSLIASQIASLAEAFNCARLAGFSADQISALIKGSSTASPIVQGKLERILAKRFDDPDFALYLLHKDARYAAKLAQAVGAPHRVIDAAAENFSQAEAAGFGALDCAGVVSGIASSDGRGTRDGRAKRCPLSGGKVTRASELKALLDAAARAT